MWLIQVTRKLAFIIPPARNSQQLFLPFLPPPPPPKWDGRSRLYSGAAYKYSAQGSAADLVEFYLDCFGDRRVLCLEGTQAFLTCEATVGFGTLLGGGRAARLGAGVFVQFKVKASEALMEAM